MRDSTRLPLLSILAAVGLTLVLGAAPVMAGAPQPVLPIEGNGPADGPDGDEAVDEEPPAEDAASDEAPYADDEGCLLPASASTGPALATRAAGYGRLLAHPAPVLPVETPDASAPPERQPCRTELSLSLVVVAEGDRKPDGADATVDSQLVPRATLESGFSTQLEGRTRTIGLTFPGEDWKVMAVSCTCGGGGAGAVSAVGDAVPASPGGHLLSYPGPVLPVGPANEPPGAEGGSASCGQAAASARGHGGIEVVAPSGHALTAPGMSSLPLGSGRTLLRQPGPVLPVEGDGEAEPPTPDPTPEPPTREPGSVQWTENGNIYIFDPDQAGGAIACTWTVEHGRGDLVIDTRTEPTGRAGRFSYQATPSLPGLVPETLPGTSPGRERKMWKGTWDLALTKPSDAWELERSECTEADATRASSAAGERATIGLDAGDRVSCTFELKLLAPREGRWVSREPATRVQCGGVSFRIPRIRSAGSIRVRDDGMRLVARGLSQGDATWRLDRQGEDSRRYAGTIRLNLGGASGRFDLVLDLVDEERMTGTFEGNIRVRGIRCNVTKPVTLRYAGN